MTDRISSLRPEPRLLPVIAAVLLMVLLAAGVAGCGDGDDAADDTTTTDATTAAVDDGTSSSTSTTESTPTSQSSTTESSTTTTTVTTTTVAGEPFEGFAQNGDVLAVMGVAYNDVLNVRANPGASFPVVATAGPVDDDVAATGEAWLAPGSIWYEVTVGGVTGWANSSFLAFVGPTDDATALFLGGGPLPETETMIEMGELVARGFASDDPPSRMVRTVAPSVGDLGEITYDVVGIGDDATTGFRLHVFATPLESGDGFVLKSIERTEFCGRGLSTGGICA